jgi:hypothetical protein
MRPVEIVEAKIIMPSGLSIRSGRRAPTSRYLGSIIVFSRGIRKQMKRNIPKVTPRCPKSNIDFYKMYNYMYFITDLI